MRFHTHRALGQCATEFPTYDTWTDLKGHTRKCNFKDDGDYEVIKTRREVARSKARKEHDTWLKLHLPK